MWSHYHHLERSLRMRCVTWPITGREGKNDPHFWNPWPQFTYSLCHFQGATTKFKPCYMRKIAFIQLSRRSITWPCIGGLPKPHVTIFWPRLTYSLYNFYGATTTIKDSFILEHPHVLAISLVHMCIHNVYCASGLKSWSEYLTWNRRFERSVRHDLTMRSMLLDTTESCWCFWLQMATVLHPTKYGRSTLCSWTDSEDGQCSCFRATL